MKDISLKELLEAGCHFGHKVSKWHPKAASFIYQPREGIHIIDLVKTRDSLLKAADFVKKLGTEGKNILFVASKRQAKGVVTEAAKKAGLPYLTSRWIGGFLTNWDEVKKNIEKLNRFRQEKQEGAWNKFPKHEIVKLEKHLRQLEMIYDGAAELKTYPDAVFIVDIKKEEAALREAVRLGIPIIAIVDTNADPYRVDYPIPANDDAVGSVKLLVDYLVEAYLEGRGIKEKEGKKDQVKAEKEEKEKTVDVKKVVSVQEKGTEEEKVKKEEKNQQADKVEEKKNKKEEKPKKRGRPKKLK